MRMYGYPPPRFVNVSAGGKDVPLSSGAIDGVVVPDGVDLIATTRDGTTVAIPGFHRVGSSELFAKGVCPGSGPLNK